MKADYKLLKYELGFAPMMMDFVRYGKRDPFSFVNYSKSYYQFVKKADPESTPELDPSSIELLSAFAREVNSGKRVEDSIALRQLVENGRTDIGSIRTEVRGLFGYSPTSDTILSAMLNVGLEYPRERFQNRQAPICEKLGYDVIESEGDQAWHPSSKFSACLSNSTFREFILDSIKYSIDSWSKSVSKSNVVDGFILYEKYSRRDIFRILQWKQSPVELNVGGYQMSGDKKNMAIFVTYEKQDHSSSTQYEDEFLDEAELKWMSKNRRDFRSPEIVELMDQGSTIRLPLFVKKSNDEGTDFYYMGELSPIHDSFEKTSITNDEGTSLSAITLRFNVDPPVERNIYKYITGD
jgi:hypothetical protein